MLVLSRKENGSIVIDGRIKVTVVDIKGGSVRLGIEAPKDVPVWRSELLKSEPGSIVVDRPCMVRGRAEPLALVDQSASFPITSEA